MKRGTEAKYIGRDKPVCDICKQSYAEYDGRIHAHGHSTWAYLCQGCFDLYGIGLGTGRGQRLVFKDETGK